MKDYTLSDIKEKDKQYYMNTFGDRTPLAFTHGEGMILTDISGKKYKDFFAGIAVSALGHSHPKLVSAICAQAEKLLHTSNVYYVENQALLAEKLCTMSGFEKAFFCSTGAEANEGAIKLARKYFYEQNTDQYEIITLNKSFHGRTITTATATGQDKYKIPYKPLTPGFKHVDLNDVDALNAAVGEHTAAIMAEMIQGEGGVYPMSPEFAEAIGKLQKEHGILFIDDEVQTGIGRTGKLFAFEHYGIKPDIVTCAKALGGGVPIAAFLADERVACAFHPGDHGTTFGGNPLSCAAALAVLNTIEDDGLIQNAAQVGEYLISLLSEKTAGLDVKIRGVGLMIGIEIGGAEAKDISLRMMNEGYLVGTAGGNVLRIVPPLIVTKNDAKEFADTLEKVLEEI